MARAKPRCPRCQTEKAERVIYAGFPAWWCSRPECSALWGFWSWAILVLPFNGELFVYEGAYLPALWRWLWDLE